MKLLLNKILEIRLTEEVFHHIQTLVDRFLVLQRENHPSLQQTGTHRADGLVNHSKQTGSAIVHATQQFQTTHRKLVQTHIAVFLNAGKRRDMTNLVVLRHLQILKNCTRSHDTVLEVFHPKTFQVLCLEMFQKLFAGRGFIEHPILQLECKELASEIPLKHAASTPFEQHFFRSEIVQQLIDVIKISFRGQKFTCRNIQKSYPTSRLSEMNGGQEIVFLVRKHIVVDGHTRCYQLRNATLHQFLGEFRVFQLVANGHTLASPYQFRKVSIKGMERKSRHFHMLGLSVGTLGKGNPQYFGRYNRIFRIGFVKVTTPEKHHCIRMFRFQLKILFHHRGKYHIISHGNILSFV